MVPAGGGILRFGDLPACFLHAFYCIRNGEAALQVSTGRRWLPHVEQSDVPARRQIRSFRVPQEQPKSHMSRFGPGELLVCLGICSFPKPCGFYSSDSPFWVE